MRLMLPSAGGATEHSMSFPTKNRPLPPVPTPSTPASKPQPPPPSKEWSPLASVPASSMGPPQQPPPGRISDAQFEINQNVVRPTTVDGAMDWINRHKPQIDQFLNLLEQYPQLVQSDKINSEKNPLPPIKRSFSESAAFPPKLQDNKLQRQSRLGGIVGRRRHVSGETNGNKPPTIKGDENMRRDDLIAGERYIYVCDVLSESENSLNQSDNTIPSTASLPSPREKIVTALSSYCFVRTGPDRLHSESEFVELTHTIANADAFILLMNSRVLASGTCYHQLAVAASYGVPIISVRESGFKLNEPLPPELQDIEIIPRRIRTTISETQGIQTDVIQARVSSRDNTDLHESQSSGFHSDTDGEDSAHPNLSDLITNCYNDSLIYVPNFHNSCISKLLGKLSEYLGEAYLDYEVSRQVNGEETALINDRMTIPQIGKTSKTIEIPGLNLISKSTRTSVGENEIEMPLKGDASNLPGTPMSTDCSTGTPNSLSKLPPITKLSAATGKSNIATTNTQQKTEISDTRTSSDGLSLDESMDARDSQYTGQSSTLDSDWDSTPDPASFMETNYIVFPSNDLGFEKRPPFTVNFPRDMSSIDRRRSSTSTDEYGFNHVQLDFKYDIIAPSPIGFSFFDEEEEEKAKKPAPKKEHKPRVKKPPKPIQVKVRNNRPVKEQQLVKMATISIKYGMPV